MREILFRGKQIGADRWIYGGFHSRFDRAFIIGISKSLRIDGFEVIPETVGQFTGLIDINGEQIFEGDIVEFDYIGNNLGVKGIEPVIFENGQFGVKWGWHKDFVSLVGFANTTLTVIGNIHDNPEFLKEGAEE